MSHEAINLTEARIRDLAPKAKRYEVRDTVERGLVVRVYPSGLKVYYVVRRVGGAAGRVERIRIAPVGDLSPRDARVRAKKLNARIADGANPAAERRQLKAEDTLGKVWEKWHAHQTARGKRSLKWDVWGWGAHLEAWAHRKLSSIRPADVVKLHRELTENCGPIGANRAIALLSSLLSFAGGTSGLANPCRMVRRNPERARERYLLEDEMRRYLLALLADSDRDMAEFFTLLLLLGVRRGSLQQMTWAEVDLASAAWKLPSEKAKTRRAQVVPLAAAALGIVKARRARMNGDGYVFPGRVTGEPLTDIRKTWLRLTGAAGLEDFRPHDLRRTHATWLLSAGADSATVAAALGHSDPTVTGIYRRVTPELARAGAEAVARRMLAAAGLAPEDFARGLPRPEAPRNSGVVVAFPTAAAVVEHGSR